MKLLRQQDYPPLHPDEGINRLNLPGMNTRLIACAKGCVIPRHAHECSEEIYVLSGKVRLNGDVLGPGDMLRTEAGESHEAEALEDTRFLVMNTLEPR